MLDALAAAMLHPSANSHGLKLHHSMKPQKLPEIRPSDTYVAPLPKLEFPDGIRPEIKRFDSFAQLQESPEHAAASKRNADRHFASMERLLGQERGAGLESLLKDKADKDLLWAELFGDYPERTEYFKPAAEMAAKNTVSLTEELSSLIEESGIVIDAPWSITVHENGRFTVDAGNASDQITEILCGQRKFLRNVLQTGALEALGGLTTFGPTTEAMAVERVLLDTWLHDTLGYDLITIDVRRSLGEDTDPQLSALMEQDPLLKTQIPLMLAMPWFDLPFSFTLQMETPEKEIEPEPTVE